MHLSSHETLIPLSLPGSGEAGRLPKTPLLGVSAAMREIHLAIGQVAAHDINVLITGETGTGKELVARAIHDQSPRAHERFLALNCAAIPETLLESELFGHEKGAFSSADRQRIGKFEQCDGGTILLDEVGDMPLPLQAKILRLLQDQTFERIGGSKTLRTNVRVLASTNCDLNCLIAAGRFRRDLYYRLNVFNIHLPPLRDRGDDITLLAEHFVQIHAQQFERSVEWVSQDALVRLRQHFWPGNVRELRSAIQRALLRCDGSTLMACHLPEVSSDEVGTTPAEHFDVTRFLKSRLAPETSDLYADLHRELDRLSLCHVLNYVQGNQHSAAKLLGIARQTLRHKLRDAGVSISTSAETRISNAKGMSHE